LTRVAKRNRSVGKNWAFILIDLLSTLQVGMRADPCFQNTFAGAVHVKQGIKYR